MDLNHDDSEFLASLICGRGTPDEEVLKSKIAVLTHERSVMRAALRELSGPDHPEEVRRAALTALVGAATPPDPGLRQSKGASVAELKDKEVSDGKLITLRRHRFTDNPEQDRRCRMTDERMAELGNQP